MKIPNLKYPVNFFSFYCTSNDLSTGFQFFSISESKTLKKCREVISVCGNPVYLVIDATTNNSHLFLRLVNAGSAKQYHGIVKNDFDGISIQTIGQRILQGERRG
ncbi:MAG: hypothetical protein CV087_04635 [Candidatus Brocadia sp. WS118]|nr:MAG: hypothetical protein CV087_04635 [Candidatus Brocadia sp. WS118]